MFIILQIYLRKAHLERPFLKVLDVKVILSAFKKVASLLKMFNCTREKYFMDYKI